jgi:hypothetical protein
VRGRAPLPLMPRRARPARQRPHGRGAVVGVVLLLGLLAGCGGGGSSGSTTAAPSTAAATTTASAATTPGAAAVSAYRARGDAICEAADRALSGIPQPTTAAEIEPYLTRSLAAIDPALARLRALKPPPALRAGHLRYVQLQAQQRAALRGLVARIRAGADPVSAFRDAVAGINRRAALINAEARDLGFTVCGRTG